MRGYKEVEVRHSDQFFDAFEEAVPVAVELRRNAESLIDFVHPEHAQASAPRYPRPRMRKPRCWSYGDFADRFQGGRWQRVERVICDGFDGRQLIPGLSARW